MICLYRSIIHVGAACALMGCIPFIVIAQPNLLPGLSAVSLTHKPPSHDLELERLPPGDSIKLSPANTISFCPLLSCVLEPNAGHQRTSALFASTSQADAAAEEQTVAIHTLINRGIITPIRRGQRYEIGVNGTIGNAIYRALRTGVTAISGGPPGTRPDADAIDYVDGTVVWRWINDAAIAGKVGLYNEVVNEAGGGSSWAQANNVELKPGHVPTFNVNTEFDFTNNSGNSCEPGRANCINLYVSTGGSNRSTSAIQLSTTNKDTYATLWGLRTEGDRFAQEADIEIDSGAKIGLALGASGIGGKSHQVAGIEDASNSPRSIYIEGHHEISSIQDTSNSERALLISGRKNISSIDDESHAPIAIHLGGSYENSQISGKGFSILPDGTIETRKLRRPNVTPSKSNQDCIAGDEVADENYIYRCVSANHWKRASLNDF